MTVRGKLVLGASALTLVAAATIGSLAIASSGGSGPSADLASAINKRAGTHITEAQVEGAFQDILSNRLDEEVAAGKLTREQADKMLQGAKERAFTPGRPGRGGPHGLRGEAGGRGRAEIRDALAKALGVTGAELDKDLRAGATPAQIATDKGVSREQLLHAIGAALEGGGAPADRIDKLAARIADHTPPSHRDRGGGQMRGGQPGGAPPAQPGEAK